MKEDVKGRDFPATGRQLCLLGPSPFDDASRCEAMQTGFGLSSWQIGDDVRKLPKRRKLLRVPGMGTMVRSGYPLCRPTDLLPGSGR